jgi:hypothetical protein
MLFLNKIHADYQRTFKNLKSSKMKLGVKKLVMILGLLLTVGAANQLKAQFTSPNYTVTNQLSCDVVVFLEFTTCPITGACCFYSSVQYVLPPGTTVNIPVIGGEDAMIIVTIPGATPSQTFLTAAGSPCVGGYPMTATPVDICGITGVMANITATPTLLTIQ